MQSKFNQTGILHPSRPPLYGLCKTDVVLAEVIDGIVLPQEGITKNGQRADRGGEIHAHDGTDTRTLDLKNVVIGSNGEVVACQGVSLR